MAGVGGLAKAGLRRRCVGAISLRAHASSCKSWEEHVPFFFQVTTDSKSAITNFKTRLPVEDV